MLSSPSSSKEIACHSLTMMTSNKTSWLNPKLVVRESRIDGKGVFAEEPITKGERLALFGGQIMPIDDIDNMPDWLQDYPMQIEERFVLGSRSALGPEDSDFFNHSCDPNSGFKGQIFLVAMRDIEATEEVTFDYAMVVSQSFGSTLVFEMDCTCGTLRCRKRITEDDWKLTDLRERYRGFFSQYLQEKIDAQIARSL
jgi:SET domain-containing protein